jgi:O-antigen ligase
MLWAIVLLLILAPLPEGSAYPWALTVIEMLVFCTVALWQFRVAFSGLSWGSVQRARQVLVPALLFVALVLVQVTPLPLKVIQVVAPGTYRLYGLTLPGWSASELLDRARLGFSKSAHPKWNVSQPQSESVSSAPVLLEHQAAKVDGQLDISEVSPVTEVGNQWKTLAIAPSMSRGALLEIICYGCLFLVVVAYPFGRYSEKHIARNIIIAVLISGLIVAIVGLIEFFVWNGKILWLFVPYDWGNPHYAMPLRASGSFINPDHFGDYLAMVLPLAVGGTLLPADWGYDHRSFHVFCGVTTFFIGCAMLLSVSRASWTGALIALTILFGLSGHSLNVVRPRALDVARSRSPRSAWALLFVTIALCLMFVGPQGRNQIDLRLQQTVGGDSGFAGRLQLNADTLAMVRDYPLLGVGLGCWPELFSHYRQPPWGSDIYREAHDDYAQLIAETGIVGFVLVGWLFVATFYRLGRAISSRQSAQPSMLIMLTASLAVVVFHEFVDFSLHTPANAILFCVLTALSLRIATNAELFDASSAALNVRVRLAAACGGAISVALVGVAVAQDRIPYPHNIQPPTSIMQSVELLSEHPAESAPHLELVSTAGDRLSLYERLKEIHTAVWLDPTNPYTRDFYARALLQNGDAERALREITESVIASPMRSTHFYLDDTIIFWLSRAEKTAIERGFIEAIKRREQGAVDGLADYYNALGRYTDSGQTYDQAATVESDRTLRENYLIGSGVAFAHSGDLNRATALFDQAMSYEPSDERSYEELITLVLGPERDLKSAETLVSRGAGEGIDVVALYDALATAAEAQNNPQMAEAALQEWIAARPSFPAFFRLGMLYLKDAKYPRTALVMRLATEANPLSGDAYYYLAIAEERDYRFADAERDFARAVKLAPSNTVYREHYADFERKVEESTPSSARLSE